MQQNAISNPFTIMQYNYSWNDIKDQVSEILNRYSTRYKMAYQDDDEQKVIIFTSLDFSIFSKEKSFILFISKIDAGLYTSMLAYEAKSYGAEMTTQTDYNRGQYFIDSFMEDMMLVY